MRRFAIFITVLAFMVACEDPIDLEIDEGPKRLVVEGTISDQEGPYLVKLTETTGYLDENRNPVINNATIVLIANSGERDTLEELKSGHYYTTGIQGIVGESYHLEIALSDGSSYYSDPDELLPVSPIDSAYMLTRDRILGGAALPPEEGAFPVVDYVNPPTFDYILWKVFIDDVQERDGVQVEDDALAQDDSAFVSGRPMYGEPINFSSTVKLQRWSLTEQAYEYYSTLVAQANNSGTPFDTPPAPIIGNLHNSTDSKEIVLGFFKASSVSEVEAIYPD